MSRHYTDYAEYLGRIFPGRKVQKISVNIGTGCPNRDGTIGTGGCIYCNNASFTPSYCLGNKDVKSQVEAGKEFFGRKYRNMDFLAYFQSYTNTYHLPLPDLEALYREALEVDGVVGMIVGTRPDCVPDETVGMLAELNREKPVLVELGVETLQDQTLQLINRGHDSAKSREAITRLADAGLHVGVHLIAGLPGEDRQTFLETLREIYRLPVETVKLHHLQVLKGTRLEEMWRKGEIDIHPFEAEEYLELCAEAVGIIPRSIAIERFVASAPPEMVVAPKWGLKNYQFVHRLENLLDSQHTFAPVER